MIQQKLNTGPQEKKNQRTIISPANNGPIHDIHIDEGEKIRKY